MTAAKYATNFNIKLNNIADIQSFNTLANRCDGHVSLLSTEDGEHYRVNAKSLLGIYSLDLSTPVTVSVEKAEDFEFLRKELATLTSIEL